MFVPDLRCLPWRQGVLSAHPVRAGRPRPQDGSAPAHPVQAERSHSQDGSAPAHPVRAGRPRSQDGTRCTAACGRDARTPRTALDAPLPAGGTPALPGRQRTCAPGAGGTLALPGRYSMHRCLQAGRPRSQDGSAPAHPVRARRPRPQDGTRCTAACGRDARAPRKASCQSEFGITLSRDRALRSLPPVRARVQTAIPAHTHTTSSGGGSADPRFRFLQR